MQQLRDFHSLQLPNSALTIGSFDGVHRGHAALIRQMVSSARENGIASVVLTFYPHPSVVLRDRHPPFYINTPEEKAALLADLGVEYVVSQPFDEVLSKVSAEEFLLDLHKHLHFSGLWVGENFAFGHDRKGDLGFLKAASQSYGFKLHIVSPVFDQGEIVSSTRVREALRAGNVAQVLTYLGRPFLIPGQVIEGSGRGKKMGVPTANLAVWEQRAYPAPGVYACLAEIEGQKWKAVTNIGVRPTFEDDLKKPVVETHLLDFEGDLYGKRVKLSFFERLRDERRFPDIETLLTQIKEDIHRAEVILEGVIEREHA